MAEVVTINPVVTYQTMHHWECTIPSANRYAANYRDELIRLILNFGVNRFRLEATSGREGDYDAWERRDLGEIDNATFQSKKETPTNDNADPNLILVAPNYQSLGFHFTDWDQHIVDTVNPYRQAMIDRGESLWINVCFVSFNASGRPAWHQFDDPDEYAEFVLAFYQHCFDLWGWAPDSWEVLLEPDNIAIYTTTEMGNAINATRTKLIAAGFTPRFVICSNFQAANAVDYFNQITAICGLSNIYEFNVHGYGLTSVLRADIAAVGSVQTAQLEFQSGACDYTALINDLTIMNVSSWARYTEARIGNNLPDNDAGFYQVNTADPNNPVITLYNGAGKYFRHFYRHVRPGDIRIDATASAATVVPVAFKRGGKYTVVCKVTGAVDFTISGLPTGNYHVRYTTAAQDDINPGDITEAGTVSVPAAGIVEVFSPLLVEPTYSGQLSPAGTVSNKVVQIYCSGSVTPTSVVSMPVVQIHCSGSMALVSSLANRVSITLTSLLNMRGRHNHVDTPHIPSPGVVVPPFVLTVKTSRNDWNTPRPVLAQTNRNWPL